MILKSIKENLTGNTKSISKLKKGFLFISTFAIANFVYAQESTINNPDATAISDHQIKDEVWKLEEDYWKYVKANDLKSYLTLWDDNFIGYPSNNIITDKEHITDWITDMYKDNNRTFNYELTRKVENVFGDIVIVLYDVAQVWTNDKNESEKFSYKITHTWRKTDRGWLIIGGMGAKI